MVWHGSPGTAFTQNNAFQLSPQSLLSLRPVLCCGRNDSAVRITADELGADNDFIFYSLQWQLGNGLSAPGDKDVCPEND